MRKPDVELDDGKIRLYLGDCMKLLPQFGDGCVEAVVTDPPYGVGLDWWDDSVPHHLCKEFHRIATGPIVWFGAAPQHRNDMLAFDPPPQRVCVWSPSFTMSHTMAHGMAYRWHPVYCWRIPKKHDGPSWDVWLTPCDAGRKAWWFHPATKPLRLMQIVIGFADNDNRVLDPFMGSGSTGVAAVRMGRRFVGIEIDSDYFDLSVKRIKMELKLRWNSFRLKSRPEPKTFFKPKKSKKPKQK